MLKAVAGSLSNGTWQVIFHHVAESSKGASRTDWAKVSVNIPCASLDHAIAVANAYNAGASHAID